MMERLRTALVESYVGAILVAWLLADGLIHLVGVVTRPLITWEGTVFARSVIAGSSSVRPSREPFPWGAALPEALSAILLLLIAYGILRWLYYRPAPPSLPQVAED